MSPFLFPKILAHIQLEAVNDLKWGPPSLTVSLLAYLQSTSQDRLVLTRNFNAYIMKRGRKVILFSSISFLIMTITILVWRKQYQCIDSVRKVNNLLEKNGFRKTCDKLKLKSLSDCNKYDKEMLKRHSSSNLKRELDHCPSYINNTKVSFHPEEKNYPLSFSILAHKDAVQFSR